MGEITSGHVQHAGAMMLQVPEPGKGSPPCSNSNDLRCTTIVRDVAGRAHATHLPFLESSSLPGLLWRGKRVTCSTRTHTHACLLTYLHTCMQTHQTHWCTVQQGGLHWVLLLILPTRISLYCLHTLLVPPHCPCRTAGIVLCCVPGYTRCSCTPPLCLHGVAPVVWVHPCLTAVCCCCHR
jgi:hypothetical protein